MAVIRPLMPDDAAPVSALACEAYRAAFGAGLSPAALAGALAELAPARLAAAIASDCCLGVIGCDGALLGFVQVAGDGGQAEICRLYVAPAAQGRGLGGRLLDAALARPPAGTAAHVVLDVWPRNARAVALYRSRGFRVTGTRPVVLGGVPAPEDDWIMQRDGPVAAGEAAAHA